ncbi:MAG: GIY-YIG nuclease family protein [Planctomycetaceae bacterium]|nr:GIY-YIG nuclease family protein [Planctomycetaceae bacterium]
MWYMYILKCSDESYYVGHTNNIQERIKRHNTGQGAKWTACRLPVKLVYEESFQSENEAIKRESQIKHWSHKKKNALVSGNFKMLKALSGCRSVHH